jgi:hypothetical protein
VVLPLGGHSAEPLRLGNQTDSLRSNCNCAMRRSGEPAGRDPGNTVRNGPGDRRTDQADEPRSIDPDNSRSAVSAQVNSKGDRDVGGDRPACDGSPDPRLVGIPFAARSSIWTP